MKRTLPTWTRLAITVLVPAWLLGASATATAGQARGGSHTSGGGEGRHADGDRPQGGDRAVPRDNGGADRSGPSDRPARGAGDQKADSAAVPSHSRPRDGNTPVGRAVPRSSLPAARGGDIIVVPRNYYGGYYPWGFGGLGLGTYYGSYYDPWYGGYSGYPQYRYSSGYEGALRLKVKPRDASVSVDGYYVGVVDDFDGIFQRLHLEEGPHRIDISAAGYEPLTVDVRIEPDQTMTYHGELKRLP